MKTSGDAGARSVGDKSRWVKEIEEALLDGRADLAVHSAKDVPGELPDGLSIVGVPARADARDALCGAAASLAIPEGARRRARAACGAARSCSPCGRTSRARTCAATSTRACASCASGEYDAIVLARGRARRGWASTRASRSTPT